ncbi:hypothetical protein F4775DRAFT_591264 [Biscogniauxia sp. FL1348]|nr:hypothetical protein F4775DRAFT_591264 [Biscogniauxia sp. FL1348]
MVSFFGLKFGGEKKQKSAEVEVSGKGIGKESGKESGTQECTYDNRESFIDEKDLLGACGVSYPENSAPEASGQNNVTATLKVSPYAPSSQNVAVLSMTDLPSPHKFRDSSYASLRQHSSNPNLARSFTNGSSTNLALGPPAPISSGSRPGTPKREKPKISPLDTKTLGSATPSTPRSLSSQPNSPPDQYQTNINAASDSTSLAGKLDPEDVPEPLRIRRPMPPKVPGTPSSTRTHSPLRGPSSPQSDHALEDSALEPPAIPFKSEARPSSRSSSRTAPSGLKAVQNASDLPPHDETFLSDRPPLPRMNTGEPVIQNVRGKWGTVKVRPAPRNGIEMPTPPQRSHTADNRQFDRFQPPPMDFDKRPDTPEWKGPWNIPYTAPQRSQSPATFGSRSSSRAGTPVAAVGAHGRPTKPEIGPVRKPTLDDYARQHESSDDDDDESDYEIPESPDSPLIPLTGPLASPYFPPLDMRPVQQQQQQQQPFNNGSVTMMQSPVCSTSPVELNSAPQDDNHSNDDNNKPRKPAFVPPVIVGRNPPTPDSTEWPLLASPVSPSSESSSSSQHSRPESPLAPPPRMPFARCESPKSPSARSFSRPWTPTNDNNTTSTMRRPVPGTPKRSETAPVPHPVGMRHPPPRAATFNTPRGVLHSPQSAAIIGGSGGGYSSPSESFSQGGGSNSSSSSNGRGFI